MIVAQQGGCPPGIDCSGEGVTKPEGDLVDQTFDEKWVTTIYKNKKTGEKITYKTLRPGENWKNVPKPTPTFLGPLTGTYNVTMLPRLVFNLLGDAGYILTLGSFGSDGFGDDHYQGLIWEAEYKDVFFPVERTIEKNDIDLYNR